MYGGLKDHMDKKKKSIIINICAVGVMLLIFTIFNRNIQQEYLRRFSLIADESKYCYGIDSLENDGDLLRLKGWFFELKSLQKNLQNVSDDDAEMLLGLIPLDEAVVDSKVEDVPIMDLEIIHGDRPDVNEYFACEYDYSKCGFTATIDCDDIDLPTTAYRLAIKTDVRKSQKAVLTNVYVTDKGIAYTDPRQSPILDTEGTDLGRIVNEGVRLVSRPDVKCYVYQLGDKLYWIADEGFAFCENGSTYIQYQMDTTQIDRLPAERLENNWFWSNIGGYFEQYEITDQFNCGKYRVSVRDIPRDYSVTSITTGYHDGENWIWEELFRLNYQMLGQ